VDQAVYFYQRVADAIAGDCARGASAAAVAGSFTRHLITQLQSAARNLTSQHESEPTREIIVLRSGTTARVMLLAYAGGALGSPADREHARQELTALLMTTVQGDCLGLASDGYHCLLLDKRGASVLEDDQVLLTGRHAELVAARVLPGSAVRRLGRHGAPRRSSRLAVTTAVLFLLLSGLLGQYLMRKYWPPVIPTAVAAPAVTAPLPVPVFYAAGRDSVAFSSGAAELVLAPGGQAMVNPGSTDVYLTQGVLDARVRPLAPGEQFRVITGSATVGVRGTRFRVSFRRGFDGRGLTALEVFEGVVEFCNRNADGNPPPPDDALRRRSVPAGGRMAVFGGRPPQDAPVNVTAMLPDYLAYLYREEARDRQLQARRAQEQTGRGTAPGAAGAGVTGSGTWQSAEGAHGSVTLTIDIPRQRCTGNFSGTAAGGLAVSGTFAGTYTGDAASGSMQGTTRFSVTGGPQAAALQGQVSGTLRNRAVQGQFTGGPLNASFSVAVRLP